MGEGHSYNKYIGSEKKIPNRLDEKKRDLSPHRKQNTKHREQKKHIKAEREKNQIINKLDPLELNLTSRQMSILFSLKALYKMFKRPEMPFQTIYPAKILFTIDGENKIFHDKFKYEQY